MPLTITLEPEIEARFQEEARQEGISVETLIARLFQERDLLWRIRTAVPEDETRELHHLLRRRNAGTLTDAEGDRLQEILDRREGRAARRLEDLIALSRLRGVSVLDLMNELGIRPIPPP